MPIYAVKAVPKSWATSDAVEVLDGQLPSTGSIDPAEAFATPSSLEHLWILSGLNAIERDVLLLGWALSWIISLTGCVLRR